MPSFLSFQVKQSSNSIAQKLSKEGWHMPAEWEPHAATWLTWPHDEMHWPGIFDRIPRYWARMTKELLAGEDMHILIHDDATEKVALKALKQEGITYEQQSGAHRVMFHRVPNNFSWTRDHGPMFVKNFEGKIAMTHWKFNGWGEQWDHNLDENVPAHIESITKISRVEVPMVLEGGSIDVNGAGSLLTTESCLLNSNRNPTMKKKEIEQHLKEYLGVTNVLWLSGQIVGDDTSGHIDDLTRFIGPRTIVTVLEEDSSDPNFAPLQINYERLKTMRDQDGNLFEIIPMNLPAPVVHESTRLPASYANFYVGNAAVLLPVFNDPNDAKAIQVLEKAFPARRIVPIDARDLVWGFGAFHCVTQQEPML